MSLARTILNRCGFGYHPTSVIPAHIGAVDGIVYARNAPRAVISHVLNRSVRVASRRWSLSLRYRARVKVVLRGRIVVWRRGGVPVWIFYLGWVRVSQRVRILDRGLVIERIARKEY